MRGLDLRLSHGLLVGVAGVSVVISWQYGYRPMAHAYTHDRAEVATLAAQLSHVSAMVHGAGGRAAWMIQQQQRLGTLKRRVPDQNQLPHVLNALVETLNASEIKLLDAAQANLQPVQDAGKPLVLEGKTCYRLPVTVRAEGRYQAILTTLDHLMADAFPSLVSLDQLELRAKAPGMPQLHATFTLSLYVTGPTPLVAPAAPSGSAS